MDSKKSSNNFSFAGLTRQIREILSLSGHIDVAAASDNIIKNIQFKGPNIYILAAAIVIASVGLNVNSNPVIIGAMLISPLMGPIIAVGYSLGINDTSLLRKAAKNLLVMVLISLTASCLYFLLSPLSLENPSELLARTNPTIFDVLIALFGGFAGIIEITKREKGTVFSGVAIATALMPPLCTAGYALASWEWRYFIGAVYLFFINSVFIALATFLTVKYLKFPETRFADPAKQRRVNRTVSFITVILIIPSVYSAVIVTRENRFNQKVNRFVAENKTMARSYIYDYRVDYRQKPAVVEISVAGDALTPQEMETLCKSAEMLGIPRTQLSIRQNAASEEQDLTDKAVVQSIFERNDQEIRKREQLIAEMETELKQLRDKELPYAQIVREILAQYPDIVSFSMARGAEVNPASLESREQIILLIRWKKPLAAEQLHKLEDWLRIRLEFQHLTIVQQTGSDEA